MTKQDASRLYDKLDEIVKAIGSIQTSIALLNQTNEARERQMLDMGTRQGVIEEAQRRVDLYIERLRGVWVPIAGIASFVIGLAASLVNDFIKSMLS